MGTIIKGGFFYTEAVLNGPWLYIHRRKFYTSPIFPGKSVTWVFFSGGRLGGVGLCYNTGLPDDMQGVIERVRICICKDYPDIFFKINSTYRQHSSLSNPLPVHYQSTTNPLPVH